MHNFARTSALTLLFWSFLLLSAPTSQAQGASDPTQEQGYKPYGSFEFSKFDSVNLSNLALDLNIPIYAIPQRGGKIDVNYRVVYNNSSFTYEDLPCPPNDDGMGCAGPNIHQFPQPSFNIDFKTSFGTTYDMQGTIQTPSGSHPVLFIDNNHYISADGTGYKMVTPGCIAANPYLEITDNQGTINHIHCSGAIVAGSYIRDVNGNQLTFNDYNGPVTDTLGRQIPFHIGFTGGVNSNYDQFSTSTNDFSGCTGPFPTTYATLWSPPGVNGQTQHYKFCYATGGPTTALVYCYESDFDGCPGDLSRYLTNTGLQSIVMPNGSSYTFEYASPLAPYAASANGDLVKVTLPAGGTVSYTWTDFLQQPGGAEYRPGFRFTRAVASRSVDAKDGSPVAVWAYRQNPQMAVTPYHQGIGSYSIAVTDPAGNDTVHTFGSAGWRYETSTEYYLGNSATGSLLKQIRRDYNVDHGGTNTFPIAITTILEDGTQNREETSYDTGVVAHGQDGVNVNISMGQVISKRVYDNGAGAPGPLLRVDTTDYVWQDNPSYLIAGVVSIPSRQCVSVTVLSSCSGPTGSTAFTAFHYDESGNPSGSRGNLTSTDKWTGIGTTYLHSSTVYNSFGMPTSSTDNGITTQTTYDSAGLFPSLVTRPTVGGVEHRDWYTYDDASGALVSHTDENGTFAGDPLHTTSMYYDPTGRQISVHYPDGGLVSYGYVDGTNPSITKTTSAVPNPNKTTIEQRDGLNRPHDKQVLYASPTCGGVIHQIANYDAFGRIGSSTTPHCSTSNTSYGVTSFTYDALSRKTLEISTSGSKLWTYNGAKTVVADEANSQTAQTVDGLNRIVKVTELDANPVNNKDTVYTYNVTNNLTQIVQMGTASETPRVRRFVYDALSRLTKSCNPESLPSTQLCDGNLNWSLVYSYDSNGNVSSKIDARGINTNYAYDALNRLTRKTYSDGTPIAVFGYDGHDENGNSLPSDGIQSDNAIGRVSLISNQVNAAEAYSYDPMGRIKLQNQFIPSVNNWGTLISAGYDLAGNMTDLTYPDGSSITQHFDTAGHIDSVKAGTSQKPGVPYASITDYLPSGSPHTVVYGNGVSETLTQNSRLQPCESVVAKGSAIYIDRQYFYGSNNQPGQQCAPVAGNNGNIASIGDALNVPHSQMFTYDSLNRIKTWDTTSFAGALRHQNFDYDSFGNLNQTNGYPAFGSPDPLTSPAAYSASQWPYNSNNRLQASYFHCLPLGVAGTPGQVSGYDAAGNTLCSGTQNSDAKNFVWDAENRMSQLWQQQNNNTYYMQSRYIYGADGNRVRSEQVALNSQTNAYDVQSYREYLSFGGQTIAEKDQSGAWSDYIYANDKKISTTYSADQALHLHGTATCLSYMCDAWASWFFPELNGYTIKAGDKIAWRQYQTATASGGIGDIWFNCGNGNGGGTFPSVVDSDGQYIYRGSLHNQWQQRTLDLTPWAGCFIQSFRLAGRDFTQIGDWDVWFSDMTVYGTDGTVTPVYHRQDTIDPTLYGTPYITNASIAIDTTTVPAGASYGDNRTTFYLADHLGTAQMEFASGGWPVWKGEFAPFGQELDTQATANRYKFTGKERDAESGLDYFGARYYSSSFGRWLSPDWSEKPDAVPYSSLQDPQTLNLYGYVRNNPLSRRDSDGHEDLVMGLINTFNKVNTFLNPGVRIMVGIATYKTLMQVNESAKLLRDTSTATMMDAAKNPGAYPPDQTQIAQDNIAQSQQVINDSATPLVSALMAVVEGVQAAVPGGAGNATSIEKAVTKGATMARDKMVPTAKAITTVKPDPKSADKSPEEIRKTSAPRCSDRMACP